MIIIEGKQIIFRRKDFQSIAATTECLLHYGGFYSGRHRRRTSSRTKQVPPFSTSYLQVRHLNRKWQGHITKHLERQEDLETRPLYMAPSTHPPPQNMGELESSTYVYLQCVEEPCTIIHTKNWNLECLHTPHRVGVLQTSGKSLKKTKLV